MRYFSTALCTTALAAPALAAETTPTLSDPSAGARPCTSVTTSTRPYVLLTADKLQQLRRDTVPGGRLHQLYLTAVKTNADHWLTQPNTIPPRSGYWHDFVCVDGTRLQPPDPPRILTDLTSTTQFACPACGRQYSGPKIEGAFRAVEHSWLTRACLDLALAGAIEQRADYRAKAADILLKYADAYPGRHTGALQGGIFYQSLDESVSFITLAQAYDLIADTGALTDAQKQHIERDLFWEGTEGLVKMGLGGNWGSWHLSAVGVVGVATRHQRFIDYAIAGFKSQIDRQLGDDGLWPESVHTYHFYPMRGFLHLAEACANVGIDLYNWQARPGKGLRAMFTAPLRYMYPNFQLPAINDGWFRSYLPLDIYQIGYNRYKLPELGWAVQQLRALGDAAKTLSPDVVDAWSLVHDIVPTQVEPPGFGASNFPVLGIACLRQPSKRGSPELDTMMTFDYGPFLSHGQSDKMGITYFAGNQLLCADYGTCSYGSKLMPYYKSTQSHNTIRFDGKDQPHTKFGRLIAFKDTPQVKLACAETTEVCPGATWRRAIALTSEYAVVLDQITADIEHQYDWILHGDGDSIEFPGTAEPVTTQTLQLSYFTDTSRIRPDQFPRAMWTSGTQPLLMLEAPPTSGTEWFTARCPAESALHQIPAVIARQHGKNATFVTMLYGANSPLIYSSIGPKLVQQGSGRIAIRTGATHYLELAPGYLSFTAVGPDGKQVEVRVELSSNPQPIGQTGIYSVDDQSMRRGECRLPM
ncbi:MAG: heparinase II/III domain-containing protein [Candidatus Sumerlaeaceae bacterium]